jgi:hypothetical protein
MPAANPRSKLPRIPEAALQSAIVDYVRAVAPQCLIFAVPNAASRDENGRPANAVAGLTAGIPDLGLMIPGGKTAWIEVKADGGSLSKAQIAIRDRMIAMGMPRIVARSVDEVRVALAHWGVQTREVLP